MNRFCVFLIILSSIGLSAMAELKINFVLYDGLNESVTDPIEVKILDNVDRICSDMGVQQPSSYTIRIWGNNTTYLAYQKSLWGTSFPGSTGYIMGANEMGLLNVSGLIENAEHEFAHSMSLILNNTFSNNPRWFWETVAIYESGEFRDPTAISYLKNNDFPTIAELDAGFNTGSRQIYEVGYLIGEFITEEWGSSKLVDLIKKNGNTQAVLGLSSVQFGDQWAEFVKEKYFKTSKIQTSNLTAFKIHPNPADDYISIENTDSNDVTVLFYDVMGRMVFKTNAINRTIDISRLQKGIYSIYISENENISTYRMLKR